MGTKTERLQVRLTPKTFRKFKAYVALLGTSMSEVTEELLREWLAAQEPTPATPQQAKDSEK